MPGTAIVRHMTAWTDKVRRLNGEPAAAPKEGSGQGVTRYVLLHGLAQHHAYHAGQIAILSKF